MKLRNKKTGEIGNLQPYGGDGRIWVWIGNRSIPEYRYNSLAELNAEWEDYEEPKEDGLDRTIGLIEAYNVFNGEAYPKEIVEKLKAWKRLKDKGFRFDGYDVANPGGDNVICGQAYFKAGNYDREEIRSDLDLLFGGEE